MQKLNKLFKPVLSACLGLACFIGLGGVSLIFFGEYPYPTESEE